MRQTFWGNSSKEHRKYVGGTARAEVAAQITAASLYRSNISTLHATEGSFLTTIKDKTLLPVNHIL